MLLTDSLKDIHPDKLPELLKSYVRDGRGPEVRQAIPDLTRQHPALKDVFASILISLEGDKPPPDMISGASGVVLSCSNCGGSVCKQAPDTHTVICQYCGCDAEHPPTDGLSLWQGRIDTQAKFSIGSYFTFRGTRWQAIGVQKYAGTIKEWDREDKVWETNVANYTLWWMLNENRELGWLSDYGSKRYWSEKYIPKNPAVPSAADKSIEYGRWGLKFAAGEFSYAPNPGEMRTTCEYSKPPRGEAKRSSEDRNFVYGTEAQLGDDGNPVEIEFVRSVAISNRDVLQGLGSSKLLGAVSKWRLTAGLLAGTAVASFVLGFILNISRDSEELLGVTSHFNNEQPQQVGEIRIEDTPALLRFDNRLVTRLVANRYVELEIELEDAAENYAGGYMVEFWRETGYDDGHWDESRYNFVRDLKIEEPGTYSISALIGSTNAGFPASVELKVKTNPVSQEPFFFSLFAGIAAGVLGWMRSHSISSGGASLGGKMAATARRKKKKGKSAKNKKKKRGRQ